MQIIIYSDLIGAPAS